MENALLLIFIGLGLGSIYGLVGLTLVITYNATRILNLAAGEFVMLGAFLSSFLLTTMNIPLIWSILILVIASALFGLVLNWLIVFPFLAKNVAPIMVVIGTYAVGVLFREIIGVSSGFGYFGTPAILPLTAAKVWIFPIVPQYGLCMIVTGIVLVGYWYFLNHTYIGRAVKATSLNRDMSRLLGISISWIIASVFAISSVIGGIAGLLVGPMSASNALMGFPLLIDGFIAAVLGGMGNPYAAVVGGLVVGLLNVLIAGYFAPGYAQLSTFLLLIGILYIRPHGIFGVREV